MPNKKYIVSLDEEKKDQLNQLLRKGNHSARTLVRARVLLYADAEKTDGDIASLLDLALLTPRDIRKRFCEGGLDRALHDASRPGQPQVLTSEEKAEITAIACTDPPDGYGRWTLDLLKEKITEKIKKVGRSTIHVVLLQSNLKPWREKNVVHSNN